MQVGGTHHAKVPATHCATFQMQKMWAREVGYLLEVTSFARG